MKKSTLFVSAALTAFVLAILAGVVTALKNVPVNAVAAAAPATVAVTEALPTQAELPTTAPALAPTAVPTQVGPMDAAGIAAQFLNQQDVYSVETFVLDGVNVFKVTFSSGDIVYVGLDGKVISTTKLAPVVTTVDPTPKPHKNKNNNNGGNSGGDDHNEHEGSEHD